MTHQEDTQPEWCREEQQSQQEEGGDQAVEQIKQNLSQDPKELECHLCPQSRKFPGGQELLQHLAIFHFRCLSSALLSPDSSPLARRSWGSTPSLRTVRRDRPVVSVYSVTPAGQ